MNTAQPTALNSRILSIDSLRGFALAGIVIVHMVEQFVAGPIPEEVETSMVLGISDDIVNGLIFTIFRGKFFALFAFLFGISFFIQMNSAARKGLDFRGRFIWRLTLLLVFGLIHNLFYRGDILTIYVLLGFFLPLFYRVPDKWILAISVLLFLGGGRYLSFFIFGDESIFGGPEMSPTSAATVAYWEVLKNGTIWEVFRDNATNGLLSKLDFQFGVFGRGYLTFGFFLMGLWVARMDLFNRFDQFKKAAKKILWWSVAVSIISLVCAFLLFSQVPQPMEFNSWTVMFALTAFDIHNIAMTALIVCGFLLLFHRRENSKLQVFSGYGKVALSNYIFQSVVGTFIFYNWGLEYIGEMRNLYALALGIVIIVGQIVLSNLWMKRFKYGPFEWLWRCGTYLKKIPFRKKAFVSIG